MTDLSDHVEWFKREVARPGTFATLYPETSDDDVAASLVDGFWKARLDGWMPGVTCDPDTELTDPDISFAGVALIIVYAGLKFVQNELKNMATRTTYKAPGGLEATTEHAATVLSEILKELQQQRLDLLDQARRGAGRGTPVYLRDGYAVRVETMYQPERLSAAFRASPLELT